MTATSAALFEWHFLKVLLSALPASTHGKQTQAYQLP